MIEWKSINVAIYSISSCDRFFNLILILILLPQFGQVKWLVKQERKPPMEFLSSFI